MVIAARMALAGRRPPRHHQESLPGDAGLAGAGGLIGLASSLFGIGGGSLTVPFLSGRGVAMREAVAVSSALDHPDIPEFVAEYVLYHELLHLEGDALSPRHGRDFRRREREHPRWEEAEKWLRKLASRRV